MTEKMKSNKDVRYIVTEKGEKVSVILPLREYESILEDIADLAAIAERREEETITNESVIARLKADGLL